MSMCSDYQNTTLEFSTATTLKSKQRSKIAEGIHKLKKSESVENCKFEQFLTLIGCNILKDFI